MNQALGDGYTVIRRDENPHDFERSMEAYLGRKDDDHAIYAFVGNGPILQPLWEGQKAFIMTEGGKTFDNLSHGKC